MKDQSFLGQVFDAYQNMQQIAACLREASAQMGLEHPRLVEFSRRPTGIEDYFPEAEWLRYPTHKDNDSILSNPVKLPFADKSLDGCLISDVYEHIPASDRPALMKEMMRITDGLVLVACPNGNELVSRLDRMVFDFIWGKYGEKFKPLAQHVEFGVEPIEQVVATLKAQGADEVTVLPANYVYRWIHMILVYFDLQHRNPSNHLFEPLNRIYNERLAPFDYREPCYRYLIAIPTTPAIQIDKLNEAIAKRSAAEYFPVAEADQMLAQTFREIDSAAADELRLLHLSMERMQKQFEAEKNSLVSDHEAALAKLRETYQPTSQQLSSLEASMAEHLETNESLRQQLSRVEASFAEQQEINQHTSQQLANAQALLDLREKELRATQAEVDRMSDTLGWRLLSRYGRIKYRYLLDVYRILGLSRYVRKR